MTQNTPKRMLASLAMLLFMTSTAHADCLLKPSENQQLNMWWQGVNPGSPKHSGRVNFEHQGASSAANMLFTGRFWSGSSAYNIQEARVIQGKLTFRTTTFDRPGRTGRETHITGSADCGDVGILGTFRYVDEDPSVTEYVFNFGMTPLISSPQ